MLEPPSPGQYELYFRGKTVFPVGYPNLGAFENAATYLITVQQRPAPDAPRQALSVQAVVPELRADFALGNSPGQEETICIGAARVPLEFRMDSLPFYPADPPVTEEMPVRIEGHLTAAYAQWTKAVSDRRSVTGQMRFQRYDAEGWCGLLGGGREPAELQKEYYWPPGLVVDYRTDDRTQLRPVYNRQAPEQDFAVLTLTPYKTLLITEPLVMAHGIPDPVEITELDVERHIGLGPNYLAQEYSRLQRGGERHFRTRARLADQGQFSAESFGPPSHAG